LGRLIFEIKDGGNEGEGEVERRGKRGGLGGLEGKGEMGQGNGIRLAVPVQRSAMEGSLVGVLQGLAGQGFRKDAWVRLRSELVFGAK
jgi:hypothetical protein